MIESFLHLDSCLRKSPNSTSRSQSSSTSTSSVSSSPQVAMRINLQADPLFSSYTPLVNTNTVHVFNMVANPPPRLSNVINLPHFEGRLVTNLDVHAKKFEIVCAANSVPIDELMKVFVATLQQNAILWISHQVPFVDWIPSKLHSYCILDPCGLTTVQWKIKNSPYGSI